ncbi:MAG: DUF6460 domain-containing protein [Pseudomonadota bacterium]
MNALFGGPVLPTLFKLAVASVVVGILLAIFGIQPIDLWRNFLDTVAHIWNMGFDALNWSVRYILLGAVVVVPIWLVLRIWTYLVERK